MTCSKSRISLHGIQIPTTIFPDSWNRRHNQAYISWPFPLLLVVDICGNRDLDLNSSRTEIILSEKWGSFEEELAYIICKGIHDSVTGEYWDGLKDILLKRKSSEFFLAGLKRVVY